MDKNEVTKLIIAAAAGAIAKEVISALLRLSKDGAKYLVGRITPWMRRNWATIDWILSLVIIWFITRTFLKYPEADAPVSHWSIRLLIIMALIWVSQLLAVKRAAERMLASRTQKPNKAPEPTPGSVTPRATEDTSK